MQDSSRRLATLGELTILEKLSRMLGGSKDETIRAMPGGAQGDGDSLSVEELAFSRADPHFRSTSSER